MTMWSPLPRTCTSWTNRGLCADYVTVRSTTLRQSEQNGSPARMLNVNGWSEDTVASLTLWFDPSDLLTDTLRAARLFASSTQQLMDARFTASSIDSWWAVDVQNRLSSIDIDDKRFVANNKDISCSGRRRQDLHGALILGASCAAVKYAMIHVYKLTFHLHYATKK